MLSVKIVITLNLIYIISSKISISSPNELINKLPSKEIQAFFLNFGKYPSSISGYGRVYTFPKETINTPNYACQSQPKIGLSQRVDHFSIIIVDRGNCSLVEMTRNIQNQDASMALIINNIDAPISEDQLKGNLPGDDIIIPSALISKEIGDIIKNYILTTPNDFVFMDIDCTIKKSFIVSVDLFLNIVDQEAYSLLKEFASYIDIIKNYIKFTPYFITYPNNNLTKEQQNDDCVSEGKYCFNLKTPENYNVKGRQLIKESLYHQCLFKVTSNDSNNKIFFTFASYYYDKCLYNKAFIQYCGKNTLLSDVNSDIMSCIYQSFSSNKKEIDMTETEFYLDNENIVLYENNQKYINYNIKTIPTVLINNEALKGRLTGKSLFMEICASLVSKPKACSDIERKVKEGNGMKWYWIFYIWLGVVVVNLIIFNICRRYIMRRIRDKVETQEFDLDGQINSVVTSYFNLKELSNMQKEAGKEGKK